MAEVITHWRARLECMICSRSWIAIWQVGAERVECPECGYMNPTPPTSDKDDDSEKDGGDGAAAR